jgi:radical SAM protein with 4Fe4S-binding SPASM domain
MNNPFAEIYKEMNSPLKKVGKLPRLVDIELTTICNMHCKFCLTGAMQLKRPTGKMTSETYERILEQTPDLPLRFSGWGEPTLHPLFLHFLGWAKKEGRLVHMNTNGTKMNPLYMDDMLALGIDSLKISFQGIDPNSYNEMRGRGIFQRLVGALMYMQPARKRMHLSASTTITYETPEQVEAFRTTIQPLVDTLTIGRTVMERTDASAFQSIRKVRPKACQEVFDKLTVQFNGDVTACCMDGDGDMVLGNIHRDKLSELWKGDIITDIRNTLAQGRYDDLSPCRWCWDYQGLTNPGVQETS